MYTKLDASPVSLNEAHFSLNLPSCVQTQHKTETKSRECLEMFSTHVCGKDAQTLIERAEFILQSEAEKNCLLYHIDTHLQTDTHLRSFVRIRFI